MNQQNLNQQQANLAFLAQYVPEIRWWEINSLEELDEKINLVNKRTAMLPFPSVPSVEEFNQRTEEHFALKIQLFAVSIIPRKPDGSCDWEAWQEMAKNPDKMKEQMKFKPTFANQNNYQELARKLSKQVNSSLSSIANQFTSLSTVKQLNNSVNDYLDEIFRGFVYSEVHDSFAEQLKIASHQKFECSKTGKKFNNSNWGIALNEFNFRIK